MLRYAVIAVVLVTAEACIYLYGDSPITQALRSHHGTSWNYSFHGGDWVGVDEHNRPWECRTGQQQSPININLASREAPRVTAPHTTTFDFGEIRSNGTNLEVINTGHTVQVQWVDPTWEHNVSVAVPANASVLVEALSDTTSEGPAAMRVAASPLQFHFHTASEHTLHGHGYPRELHLVSTVKNDSLPGCTGPLGCPTVVGVWFELDDDLERDNEFLKDIVDVLPMDDLASAKVPAGVVLDLAKILPENQTYVTYLLSLTTPPCTEGVLWHVMTKPLKMSLKQLHAFQQAMGESLCQVEPPKRTALLGSGGRKVIPGGENNSTSGGPKYKCHKLGNGRNNRDVQPLHNRTLYVYHEK